MTETRGWRRYLPRPHQGAAAAVIALAALWITGPVLATGSWWGSDDGMRYPYLVYRFTEAVSHGIFYPRWLPELMGGYGYPTFIFYQPGYFFFMLPFAWLFADVLHAAYAGIFAMLAMGGAGAYLLARRYNPPALAMLFACIYLFSPYIGTNLFVRGDLSELFAMLLCPWGVYFALKLPEAVRSGGRAWPAFFGVAAGVALAVVSHPFVALFFLPLLAALLLLGALRPAWNAEALLAGLLALALGAVLSMPYWLPLLQLKEAVYYHSALEGAYNVLGNLDPLWRLLAPNARKPGIWYLLLAVTGYIAGWHRREVRFAAVALGLSMFLMHEASRFVWEWGYGVLKYVQFPWRIRAVTTTLAYMGIVQLGALFSFRTRREWKISWLMLSALAVLLLCLAQRPFYLLSPLRAALTRLSPSLADALLPARVRKLQAVPYYSRVQWREKNDYLSMQGPEFNPKHMDLRELPNRLVEPVPAAQWGGEGKAEGNELEVLPESDVFRYRLNVSLASEARVLINQFYFPGWKILSGGKPVPWRIGKAAEAEPPPEETVRADIGANGRIRIHFTEPGTYELTAWYDGPPGWFPRNLALFALAGGVLLLYARRRRIAPLLDRLPPCIKRMAAQAQKILAIAIRSIRRDS